MSSRQQGDGESPSASTYFLPQFRQSRRGSIASLASINQIDKEALSQALDHIHNTASQTDKLTTFNEFGPPPSSSTLDTKGLASELQGGISGLYNRFRASVGNVIDASSVVGEDDAADRQSTSSLPRPSPTPSIKDTATPTKALDQSPSSAPDHSRATSGQQSFVSNASNRNYVAGTEGNIGQGQSKLNIAQDASSGKSLQPTQVRNGSLVSYGGKEDADTTQPTISPRTAIFQDAGLQRPESHRELPTSLDKADTLITKPLVGHLPSQSRVSVPEDDHQVSEGAHLEQRLSSKNLQVSADMQLGETQKGVKSSPANEKAMRNPVKKPQDLVNNRHGTPSSRIAVDPGGATPDRLDVSDTMPSKGGNGAAQHIGDFVARKSMAPPLVSHGASPQSRLSRASSTDTNTDSVRSAQRQLPARQNYDHMRESHQPSPLLHVRPLQRDPRLMNVFSQSRNKVLSKEYWMKDEGARECFNCGEGFSTFRRKHHCRICGQIFDSRCTSILSGERFGQAGPLRVCKPCESTFNGRDDSSDVSDDANLVVPNFRPRHGSTGGSDRGDGFASPLPGDLATRDAQHRSPGPLDFATPMMSIPATRKTGEKAGRKPTVLEIDASHKLARPSSSRSLKSAFGSRSHFGGHRRHNSRALQRGFKALREDEAPFHQDIVSTNAKESRLPAFHDDNIIDPDLAPYLSEEESSGDEQVNIMAALSGDGISKSFESERPGLGGFSSGSRKGRSKFGEKSMSSVAFASRDSDNHSLHSVKIANAARSAKRRNLSFSGVSHLRPSPRNHRAALASLGSGPNLQGLHESISSSSLGQTTPTPTPVGVSRMIRSSSMRGDAAPAIELNNASLQHVKKLLKQLLVDSKISNIASWEKALIPILLRATDDVNPDVSGGDDIDIRHYVKLKKIPGGRPGDTSYVSGLVFTKNLALKSMPRSIAHPNIIILTFPLEYTRYQQHFMSLEPVIRQEREFLQNLVNRIAALRPQLLLVERNVSGLAMELLAQADIATAYNVKSSVLEAVSRCCQTRIISSIDKLAVKPAHPGKCASFYLRTYVYKGRKKTYMFLSGCAKELGCTIVLRGDDETTLSKMKRITEFMTYVVYNLKLETCLMRDEYASIPAVLEEGSLSPSKDLTVGARVSDPPSVNRSSTFGTENSTQSSAPSMEQSAGTAESDLASSQDKTTSEDSREKPSVGLPREDSVPDDVPMPTFYGDMVEQHQTKILSASPFVKFMQPYLLMRAREQERRLAYLKRLRDQDILEEQKVDEKPKAEKFDLINPEMIHEIVPKASRKVREVLHAVHDAEYDKALHTYQTQTKQWETYIAGSIHLFDPYAHQNIAVLYSLVCTVTTVPCAGPDLVALGFYNEHETDNDFEADCTLGQYVEDLCLSAKTICTSNGCEKKMTEHHRQYVHGEAQLSVFVEQYSCKVQDMQDSILMWSVCRICEKETPAMLMSENTWKYSFGKYLELSFWSSNLKARGEHCPHDLHRDHLRYFGYRNMALRVHYDPITLLEIIVPRARITWKVDNDLRFKNDLFTRIEERMNRYMLSVRARIKSINIESVAAEKVDACKEEVDRLSKKAADEHHSLVQKLRKRYMNSKHFEIIPLNRAIRATQEKVVEWDNVFADFDRNFLPSEKDIRRLATLQLKSIFMEQEDPSKTSSTDGTTTPSQDLLTEKSANGDALAPQTRDMSQEKADEFLASVVEKHVGGSPQDGSKTTSESNSNEASAQSLNDVVQLVDNEKTHAGVSHEISENVEGEQNPAKNGGLLTPTQTKSEATASKSITVPETRSPSDQSGPKPYEVKSQDVAPALDRTYTSSIPRPVELTHRLTRPQLVDRNQSQLGHARSAKSSMDSSRESSDLSQSSQIDPGLAALEKSAAATKPTRPTDKKFSDRLGLTALKAGGAVAHSMIPRSIGGNKGKSSKVSSLARHFEQLSREFERERIKERRERQATNRQSRAYPMAVSKPIVQVYKNVQDAVEQKDTSEEELLSTDPSRQEEGDPEKTSQIIPETKVSDNAGEDVPTDKSKVDNTEAVETTNDESRTATDMDEGLVESDEDYTIFDDLQIPGTSDEHHALTEQESQLNLRLDLPKHEKSSILKMLTNFWAERTASGWQPLDYPLNATDHIFADSDIIVREDEPSSLIAFAMTTEDYQTKISSFSDSFCPSSSEVEKGDEADPASSGGDQNGVEQALLRDTGTHLQYQFAESTAKMLCKVFYAEQFDAVRRKCGVSDRFVEALSRCMKWDSKGGKTKSVFLKTLDDRFVLKSLSPIEVSAFLRFAPAYFRIMSESLFHELPSVIAKMLGFYQVIIKNPVTGIEFNYFLLVMENLFYDRSPTRIFDLKGSMRNRRIQSTGEQNEVLLDENMVEFIYESPLFAREHSKKILRSSVWNDTLFLARQNVMDYSLMIAIDENRKELVVGIIDCIRTYTWDKKLETWIKDRGKNRPTVTSPKEYKSRFREAMSRYVLQAPNCWHQFEGRQQVPMKTLTNADEPGEEKVVHEGA